MKGSPLQDHRATFGTSAVFFTAISTILGAILFLRFGYAVAHVGFVGVVVIIVVGHLVTIPTAMAIAEIATNQRVEGGGEYFILSRSFGAIVGGAIGTALYFSQAISAAFYMIAFAEATDPLLMWLGNEYGFVIEDKRLISIPVTLVVLGYILRQGASAGLQLLYGVVAILLVSLGMFFLGPGDPVAASGSLVRTVDDPDSIFIVFAICFPAFTGMTAGVGLSGDLRDPKKSIPIGTLSATIVGMLVYVLASYKMATTASLDALANDQLVMSRIALWGPIVPIGLAAATISSAVGSMLVAPRTLQAIASDKLMPTKVLNSWLAKGRGKSKDPFNATAVSAVIALAFVALGNVDVVARVISMFFMVTYGSICLVSFLQHFAADPSYRPSFRSRWYVSLFGAVLCIWLAFQMSQTYALLAFGIMLGLYLILAKTHSERRSLTTMFQGAIFQASRQLQVFLQKARKDESSTNWRPSVVSISSTSFQRLAAFDLLRWMSHRYGFGTYLHYFKGYLSKDTSDEAKAALRRLVRLAEVTDSNVFVDTIVSPSYTSAIAQVIQLPGISGKENNMIIFEYAKREPEDLAAIVDNYQLVANLGFDVCILATNDRGFGYHQEIHIWLTPADYENSSLMILLAYIILGHPDWKKGEIRIFSIIPEGELEESKEELQNLILTGRIPVAEKNIEVIPRSSEKGRRQVIEERSSEADLVILGFRGEAIRHKKIEVFQGYEDIGNVLFVNTKKEIDLVGDQDPTPEDETEALDADLDAEAGSDPGGGRDALTGEEEEKATS